MLAAPNTAEHIQSIIPETANVLVNFSEKSLSEESLASRRHWIFDMDGTLTIAIHDFDDIRSQLNLPTGEPILEAIARLPEAEARATHQKLDEIELEIASHAQAQPGAKEVLEHLRATGRKSAILTRNGKIIANDTLKAAGLDGYFTSDTIISRDCCAAKPLPDGVLKLMQQWQAEPDDTVMVGDYLYDLKAGKDAGAATVHLDVNSHFAWPELTSIGISHLNLLLNILK